MIKARKHENTKTTFNRIRPHNYRKKRVSKSKLISKTIFRCTALHYAMDMGSFHQNILHRHIFLKLCKFGRNRKVSKVTQKMGLEERRKGSWVLEEAMGLGSDATLERVWLSRLQSHQCWQCLVGYSGVTYQPLCRVMLCHASPTWLLHISRVMLLILRLL